MCGVETSTVARVGARVDFLSESQDPVGSLIFLDPHTPDSTTATHVRFTSKTSMRVEPHLLVSIQYGNMQSLNSSHH
jgi:hypothetical protein